MLFMIAKQNITGKTQMSKNSRWLSKVNHIDFAELYNVNCVAYPDA